MVLAGTARDRAHVFFWGDLLDSDDRVAVEIRSYEGRASASLDCHWTRLNAAGLS
ncbi:MAG TPA: hypothetical protein VK176_12555 [Phycisphaerales bacterium]|nr:hypothetical protein [Phycisphaerales bacterium]